MAGETVAAVLFDRGGTLTPWHTVDLARQRLVDGWNGAGDGTGTDSFR